MNVSDAVGNTGDITDTATLDTVSPVTTLDALTTRDTTPQLTGTVDDPDAVVTVTVDGTDYTATNNGDGTWTLADDTFPEQTVDGIFGVTVNAIDPAGNPATEVSGNIEVDPGSVPNITLAPLVTNDTTPALTGTVDIATATVVVTVNGIDYTATNNGDGTWILADDTLPVLSEGDVTVTVTATEPGGLQGTDTGVITIDTTAPTNGDGQNSILIADGGDGSLSSTEASNVMLTGTVESGATVNSIVLTDVNGNSVTVDSADISVDGSGNVSVSGQDISGLDNGIITATMNVSDTAGNVGNIIDTSVLDVQVAPVVSLGGSDALLGLVGADALNAVNLGESQAFAAFDENNDITQVRISTSGLSVNLATVTYGFSQEMADAFGLSVTTTSQGLLGGVAGITVVSNDGSTIDNLVLNEFLATVYFISDGVSLAVAPTFEMEAIDSQGNVTSDSSNELLGADVLNVDGPPDNINEGTNNADTLDFSAETESLRIYGYGGDDVITGGSNGDLLRGGDGNDTMNGGAGSDLIIAGNGQDVVDAGADDDTILLVGDESVSIDGGEGNDTLLLVPELNLDFTSGNLGITNIEAIDFGTDTTTENTLTLTEQAVTDLTDEDNELIIEGNATDTVTITGATLNESIVIADYSVYSLGSTLVIIDDDINVNV